MMIRINIAILLIVFLNVGISKAQVPSDWQVDPSAFQYQMSVTSKVTVACTELTDPNNYVAAFVGTQCRGVAKTNVAAGNLSLALLTIKSNLVSGELVKFKVYVASSNTVIDLKDSVSFVQGNAIGTLTQPFVFYSNYPPTKILLSDTIITENKTIGSLLGTLSAIDSDPSSVFSYSFGNSSSDNAGFILSGGQLLLNSVLDFEADSVKILDLQVADGAGCTFRQLVNLYVKDTNEAPYLINLNQYVIYDHQQPGAKVGLFSVLDQDINDQHTFQLVSGQGDQDNSQFVFIGDTLFNTQMLDHATHPAYSVRVRCTDIDGLYLEQVFQIVLSNVNDAPQDVYLLHDTISENLPVFTAIGQLAALDSDLADTFVYELVSGPGSPDNYRVEVVGDVLYSKEIYNYELQDSLFIRVKVTDLNGASFQKALLVKIINANDLPVQIELSSTKVKELQSVNSFVGKLSVQDEDLLELYQYALVNGAGATDNNQFIIRNDSLFTNFSFVYTTGVNLSIRVRATDGYGLFIERALGLLLEDIAEAPIDLLLSADSVEEGTPPNHLVCYITAIDKDVNESFTFSLVSGSGDSDNEAFDISGNQLLLRFQADNQVRMLYQIRIRVVDKSGLFFEKAFEIVVKDLYTKPLPLLSANYISPNGDGKNDFWEIDNVADFKEYKLQIFDQFGREVYTKENDYKNQFDGYFQGKPLPSGNYLYLLTNGEVTFKGNISIVN